MELEYFIFTAIIAFSYVVVKFLSRKKKQFILPSTIFMLMWGLAITASIISQINGLDKFSMGGYKGTALYILLYVLISLIAFYFSGNFVVVRNTTYEFNAKYVDYILSKLKFFIYCSFLLGLFRIYIIISHFGWDSLYDYRQSAFLIGKLNLGIYDLVGQVSAYVYVLATFFIVLLAIKHALTSIDFKEFLLYFILFAAQSLSIGGRMFVLDFISCYFFIFILIRSKNKKILTKSEFIPFMVSVFAMLFIVMALGVLRNDSNNKSSSEISKSDYYSKFLYLQDGIIYTSVFFAKEQNRDLDLDYGKNITSIDRDNTTFAKYRNRSDMDIYMPIVTGVIVPLFFDFGYTGSLLIWFLICLYFEVIAKKMLSKVSLTGILLVFILMRYFYDSPLLIAGGRGFFRYLFVLFILHKCLNRYFLSYNKWLAKYPK